MSEVEVGPIRDAVLHAVEGGLSWSEICLSLGWESKGYPDTSRLKRRLGITTQPGPNGPERQVHIRTDTAAEIVRAVGIAPMDVGL